MENKDQFKVGDKVFIQRRHSLLLTEVTSVTPTGRVYAGDMRFTDGWNRGDKWDSAKLILATPESITQFRAELKLRDKKSDIKKLVCSPEFGKLNPDSINKIHELLFKKGGK